MSTARTDIRQIHFGYRKRPLPDDVRAPFKAGQLWDMTEGARAFHRCPSRLKAFIAGLGTGKTYAAVRQAGFYGFSNRGREGLVIEPRYDDLVQIFCPAFDEALEDAGLEKGKDFTYHQTHKRYRVLGGMTAGGFDIQLRSGDDPGSLVGINSAWGVIDEASRMPWEIVVKARQRIRVGSEQLALVGTPDPGTEFVRKVRAGVPGLAAFHGKTSDNPRISAEKLEEFKRDLDPITFAAMVNGELVTVGGGAYRSFSDAPYPDGNIRSHPYDSRLPVILCMDNNQQPMCGVLAQLVGDQLRVFDEVTLPFGSYSTLVSTIVRKLDSRAPPGFVLAGDAKTRGDVTDEATSWGGYAVIEQHLKRAMPNVRIQLDVPAGNPLQLDRLLAVNARLCSVDGKRHVTFDPRAKETIDDYRSVQADPEGNIVKKGKGSDPERTHHSDALDYFIVRRWPIKHGAPGARLGILSVPLKPGR